MAEMEPVEALERIADAARSACATVAYKKSQAFRRAADAIRAHVRATSCSGSPTPVASRDLPGIGASTARSIDAGARRRDARVPRAARGREPRHRPSRPTKVRAALRGDLHLHSDWSDGGATIEAMARKAIELGHDYLALTDHSPQLTRRERA